MPDRYELAPHRSQGLVDILDRILDKGLVIAGDIRIHLASVELLTIQIRLVVCSMEKADEMGMNWWRSESYFRGAEPRPTLPEGVAAQLDRIERRLSEIEKHEAP